MLLVACFEAIDRQRGIAWRCADSLSLREFLGFEWTDAWPAHSSMTGIRQRPPGTVFDAVFPKVLGRLMPKGLLFGRRLGADATSLAAYAAIKAVACTTDGKTWRESPPSPAEAQGVAAATAADLTRLDRARQAKKVSNAQCESPADPNARIARMEKGRARPANQAGHAVDLEGEAIVHAVWSTLKMELVYRGDVATREQATVETSEFFEASCNRQRARSAMNFLSPVDSELLQDYP